MKSLRDFALSYPGTVKDVSCNKAAFKSGGKAFLFIGSDEVTWNVMLKLGDSLPEARKLATKHPGRFHVGGIGWVKLVFPRTAPLSQRLMERWIDESFRLLAPKKQVALLSSCAGQVRLKPKSAKPH